jgi:hypothetical protein
VKTETHPEIAKFIETLVDAGLLAGVNEGIVLAKNIDRHRPDFGFMADVVGTRAAHKKYGSTG